MKENGTMYKVHHIFPETGEWGSTNVDTLCEALNWYRVKVLAPRVAPNVVTLFGRNDEVIMRHVK